MVFCQGDFSAIRCREFACRRPLEMTYIGNVVSIALIASDISILSRVNDEVTGESEVKYAN